jgi:hypothetical protein
MTDAEIPAAETPLPPKSRVGLFIGLGAGGLVVFAAIVTFVLIISLGVIASNGFPLAETKFALLNGSDLAQIDGVELAQGLQSEVKRQTLQGYIRDNPSDDAHMVTPAVCAQNLEGWLAWKSLDTPAYKGWKTDTIYEASNIVVNATANYENGIQEVRHFATVGAATAFMNVERKWYHECAATSYKDPENAKNDSAFNFSPISLNLGLDSIVEGSTDTGRDVPPHLIDVYLRNQNLVFVTELVTNRAPRRGIDKTSAAIVNAAAKKLGTLP